MENINGNYLLRENTRAGIFHAALILYHSLNSAFHSTLLCPRHDIMENVFCLGCAEKKIQALVTRAPLVLSQEGLSDFK